jgi:hypothetical protein
MKTARQWPGRLQQEVHLGPAARYFAAVGSGVGLSERVFR